MTRLLVSVRHLDEVLDAMAGGADVIDVKDPRAGSLGAANAVTRSQVRQAVEQNRVLQRVSVETKGTQIELSAACGELVDFVDTRPIEQLDGFAYAKIGLAGCVACDWLPRWRQWITSLPHGTAPVAVIYADYRAAKAPTPWNILEAVDFISARVVLIDTWNKGSGNLFDLLPACELVEIILAARERGCLVALAGSITTDRLEDALQFGPDWVAVRGAVCRGGREATVDRGLVKQFAMRLSTPCSPNAVECDR